MKGIGVLSLVIVLGLSALFLFSDNYQQKQIDQLSRTQAEIRVGVEQLDIEVKRLDTEVVSVKNNLEGVKTELVDLEQKLEDEAGKSQQKRERLTAEVEKLSKTLSDSAIDQ